MECEYCVKDFDMKKTLYAGLMALAILFSGTATCAAATDKDVSRLFGKALVLTSMACYIYPRITNDDVCYEKVMRKILSDRKISAVRQGEIFLDLDLSYLTRHPLNPSEFALNGFQLKQRQQSYKLLDVINASCAAPPSTDGPEECMDKSYHSILSSRDPHSQYLNVAEAKEFMDRMSGNLEGIGASLSFSSEKVLGIFEVFEGSPAESAGLLAGDRIVAVVNGADRSLATSFAHAEEAIKKIKGAPNSSVTLEVLRGANDEKHVITIVRAAVKVPMVKSQILTAPEGQVGVYLYIKIGIFGDDVHSKFLEHTKSALAGNPNATGTVFDLRGNGGGNLSEVHNMVDSLQNDPNPILSIRDNNGIHAYKPNPTRVPRTGDILRGLPCAVLVDRFSASASEVFSGALKLLGRCVIIGEGTWQKGSIQSRIPLGDETFAKLNIAEYLIGSPTKWVAVQCVGVTPDIHYVAGKRVESVKEAHECDNKEAIASGGVSSHPEVTMSPLILRDPALHQFGLYALNAVRALDGKSQAVFERIRKLLKIKDLPDADSLDQKEKDK